MPLQRQWTRMASFRSRRTWKRRGTANEAGSHGVGELGADGPRGVRVRREDAADRRERGWQVDDARCIADRDDGGLSGHLQLQPRSGGGEPGAAKRQDQANARVVHRRRREGQLFTRGWCPWLHRPGFSTRPGRGDSARLFCDRGGFGASRQDWLTSRGQA
ncbi:hypothetical protein D9M68_667210 [compost metagenome]